MGSATAKAVIVGSAVLIGIGILLLTGLIVPRSIGLSFISSMIITLSVPPFATGILDFKSPDKYKNWVKIGTIDFKTMLSMNASIITGSLIFITISNLGRNFILSGLFTPDFFLVSTTSLVTALAALIIIPFAASSILFLLNGPSISGLADHRHRINGSSTTEGAIYSAKGHQSGTPVETKGVPAERDPGLRVAIIYMMAGFLWIITSMGILLYFAAIAPPSDEPRFAYPLQDVYIEASPGGKVINYTIPEAIDIEDGIITENIVCNPPPINYHFPSGATVITCSGEDLDGNELKGSFRIIVTNEPPVIEVPDDIEEESDDSYLGAQVTYTVTAQDTVDGTAMLGEDDGSTVTQDNIGGNIDISCEPTSGTTFPVGETIVDCIATDAVGNNGTTSFLVIVNPPPDLFEVPDPEAQLEPELEPELELEPEPEPEPELEAPLPLPPG